MQGMLQQLQLQQDFLRNQGKEDFRFQGDPDDYPALLMKYAETTKNATSDEERFTIGGDNEQPTYLKV